MLHAPPGGSTHRGRKSGEPHRRPSRDESGSILVLFSIFITLLIMCCAIVIDVGYWWANAKKAQIAADSCALAAAGDPGFPKPYNQTHCNFGAQDYVLTNIPDQSDPDKGAKHLGTKVTAPYKSTPKYVEAIVDVRVRTFFGRIVGLNYIDLTRRAVAEKQEGDGNYAIYSHSRGCPEHGDGESLEFDGNTHSINGRVHSNGQYLIGNDGGVPYEPFWAKIGTRVDCVSIQPHDSARFGGDGYSTGQTKPDEVPVQTWPAWWTPADFGWRDQLDVTDVGCDVKGKTILIKEGPGGSTVVEIGTPIGPQPVLVFPTNVIPIGLTYCATEKFTINRQNLVATLSALSPEIIVDENNQTLAAHAGNAQGKVLFFTVPNIDAKDDGSFAENGDPDCDPKPSKELKLNGNGHKWTGSIFNPCGRVLVNVGGSSVGSEALTGTILGFQVRVNGEKFFMIGKDSFGGSAALALVE